MLTEDVGGAFGLKTGAYPEYLATMVGAQVTGRPMHWMSSRSEAFLSDNQARDTVTEAELALDASGRFLALRIRHTRQYGRLYRLGRRQHPDAEFHPLLARHVRHQAYGRERALRLHQHGADRALSRRRTAGGELCARARGRGGRARDRHRSGQGCGGAISSRLPPCPTTPRSAPPSTAAISKPVLDKALALADVDGFKRRRREAARRGKYRGHRRFLHARACRRRADRRARCSRSRGDGTVTVGLNVQSTGQGHASVFPRLAAERLGMPAREGPPPARRFGARNPGLRLGRVALGHDGRQRRRQTHRRHAGEGQDHRGELLEAAEGDIAYEAGSFTVVGTDRRISLFELAARAAEMKAAAKIAEDLDTSAKTDTPPTFPTAAISRRSRSIRETGRMDGRRLCGGRRLRQRARPHDRGGPAAWRARAGARPGPDGARGLRRRRPAHHRLVHGLRHAARRRHARHPGRAILRAGDHQSARRQGRRRSRHHGRRSPRS